MMVLATSGIFLALLQLCSSLIVNCPDQSEFCECAPDEDVCEFTFRVEGRLSFTSYTINQTNQQLMRYGHVFFLNSSGYYPAFAYRPCTKGVVNGEDLLEQNCSIPMTLDGVNYRPLLLINGRIPGPTLIVTEGQILIVHVFNYLQSRGISIHWHGMFQKHSTWMDGVGYITQPPIDAGSSFDYIFKAEPSGTHWYHSHISTLRIDGLFGALIVKEKMSLAQILNNPMYDSVIDNTGKHTFTIVDWQRKEDSVKLSIDVIPFYNQLPLGQIPTDSDEPFHFQYKIDGSVLGLMTFWSGLINGRGRRNSSIPTPLTIFSVEKGKMYRFRMICSSINYGFRVSVDGHKLKAIASDGSFFESIEVDYIIIQSGETYDFLLEANNEDGMNFWVHADTLAESHSHPEASARAILTYGNPSDLDWRNSYSNVPEHIRECTSSTPCKVLNCPFENYPKRFNMSCILFTSLIQRPGSQETDIPRFPPDADCKDCMHFLNLGFQGYDGFSSINAKSFKFPQSTYATNCFQYEREKNDNLTNTCNKLKVDINSTVGGLRCIDVIEIANMYTYSDSSEPPSVAFVISNIDNIRFSHPVHLHGHSFHVVYVGYGQYNRTTGKLIGDTEDIDCGNGALCAYPKWKNGVPAAVLSRTSGGRVVNTAIKKDTITVPPGGYVVIAFQANNPGYWFIHCHVDKHLQGGMTAIIQEYSSDSQWTPPTGMNLHGSFNWNLDEYKKRIASGEVCTSPTSVSGSSSKSFTSLIVSWSIIALLILLILIFVVVIILMSCHKHRCGIVTISAGTMAFKKNRDADSSKKEVPLSKLTVSEGNVSEENPPSNTTLSVEDDKVHLINTKH